MACTRPLKGYAAPDGKISFKDATHSRGFRNPSVVVKCGQCLGCRMERKRGWAIRAVHEAQMHGSNCFLTLTYDNEHLPRDGSVVVRDWQLFAKRVRKEMGPFRFLHCGEYGELLRPHYHACVFGLDWREDWKTHPRKQGKKPLWTSGRLSRLWGNGFSTIGSLSFDSAAYVAGYTVKVKTGKMAEAAYERINTESGEIWRVSAEYATMSRNPGLGHDWYEKYHADVYPGDFVVMKGVKFRPPTYYDTLLEKQNPDLWEEIKAQRQAIVKNNEEYQSAPRLKAKETVLQAKLTMYQNESLD